MTRPLGKSAIEAHVEAHVERLSRDGAFFTVPMPRGDELVQIQVYAHPAGHWHYVTYGFTSLYEGEKPPAPGARDGFGYELGLRVPRTSERPSTQPMDLLRALARVLVQGRHVLAPGHTLPLHGPIAEGSKLSAFAVAADPELGSLVTPLGSVDMLLLVGITAAEEAACARGSTSALLDRLRALDPLLVTRHDRDEIAVPQEPSRLDGQQVISVRWRWDAARHRHVVQIEPARARAPFADVIVQRLTSAGVYWIGGPDGTLRFERGEHDESEEHTLEVPPMLLVRLGPAGMDRLRSLDRRGPVVSIGDCEITFGDASPAAAPAPDPRIERVRAAFAPVVPTLANGTIVIERVAGTPGAELLIGVRSKSPDVYAPGDMIGMGGHAIRAALSVLGGTISIVDMHPDPLVLAQRALGPVTAAQYAIDEDGIALLSPCVEVRADDPRTDAQVLESAAERVGLAAQLVGRPLSIEGSWTVKRSR